MYSAFKTAQQSMNEILLKLTEDSLRVSSVDQPVVPDSLEEIKASIADLRQKQDAQYATLTDAIRTIQAKITELTTATNQCITTSSKIPELHSSVVESNFLPIIQSTEKQVTIQIDESQDEEVEEVEEVEEEVEEEDRVADQVAEEAAEEAAEEEVEEEVEEVEVEEWTYKGMSLFKDSNNMVYANVKGEIGDQIGIFNPVKGTVKRI